MKGEATLQRVYLAKGLVPSVHLDLTMRCNFGCIHCLHGTADDKDTAREGELRTAELLALLDELADAGVLRLALSGGEIGVHEGFDAIVMHARARGFDLTLKSNGTILTPARVALLARIGVRRVDVSVYSLDPTVHDGITRRPGSLRRTLEGLDRALAAGLPVVAAMPVMAANEASAAATIRGLRARGLRVQVGTRILGEEEDDARWEMNLDPARLDEVRDAALTGQGPMPPPQPQPLDSPGCRAGFTTLYVSPAGEVAPCVSFPLTFGNVRETPFRQILAGLARQDFLTHRRRDWTGCQGCVLLPYCQHCGASAMHLTGRPWRRHPTICRQNAQYLAARGGRRVGRAYAFGAAAGADPEER